MTATGQSWPNLKLLPLQRARLSLQREYTEQEYQRICHGLIPRAMEDKWLMFTEQDTLYIHRSRTGYCVYQLSFIRQDTGSGYSIGEALVNRDASQYSGVNDRYDEKLLMYLIDSLLPGGRAPLPITPHLPAGIATQLHLHHVAGAGHRAEKMPKEVSISGVLKWLGRWLLWLIRR